MGTITAGEFRNGKTVTIDGRVCVITDFLHVKPGKGAAFVRTKYKDIVNGGVYENSFNPTAKFEEATVVRTDMQYLYNDGDMYNFMDPNTYEQIALPMSDFKDEMRFVKDSEGIMCKLSGYEDVKNGNAIVYFSVEPPTIVELRVIDTEPGLAGNTATNTLKPATVETGVEIRVPLFIDNDEMIKIDTRTGEYAGRVNK